MSDRLTLTRRPRPALVIAVLAFAGMSGAFMQTILIPIQSELPALLSTSRANAAWVITATLLVGSVCTPVFGKLGDMYGKRRVALVLLGVLVAGSLLCALSSTVEPMIVGRALQGAGMGVIPLGISILRDTVQPERLGSAIALVSATLGVGGALGLPISAIVTQYFEWHALFWLATALAVASFVLYATVIPPSTLRTGGRIDVGGVVGLAVGLTGFLLGLSKGNEWGWASIPTWACIIGGLAVLVLWGLYELRQVNPLVDLRVSARPSILRTNLASVAMGFALFSSSIVFPQLLQLPSANGGLGIGLLPASLVLMPAGLAMLAMSPVAGALGRRFGPKVLLMLGAAVIAISYVAAVFVPTSAWSILVINTVIGIGIGLGYAAMPTLIMRAVPSHETGAANGLNTLMRGLGTTVAAAVIAAVLAQSATGDGVPSLEGFHLALLLGLIAAAGCLALAALIPTSRPEETHPSLPGA